MDFADILFALFVMPPCMALELPLTLTLNLSGVPIAAVAVMSLWANLLAIPLHRSAQAKGKVPPVVIDGMWLTFAGTYLATLELTYDMLYQSLAVFLAITAVVCVLRRVVPSFLARRKGAKQSQALASPPCPDQGLGPCAERSQRKAPERSVRPKALRLPNFSWKDAQPSFVMHLACALFLILLTGCLIPALPLEPYRTPVYVDPITHFNPVWYLSFSLYQAVGAFGVWATILYLYVGRKGKLALNAAMLVMCVGGLCNYLFFGTHLGRIMNTMIYVKDMAFATREIAINTVVMVVLVIVVLAVYRRGNRVMNSIMPPILTAFALCFGLAFATMLPPISKAAEDQIAYLEQEQATAEMPSFTMSKKGKNVVVIMMDRGFSTYFPFIMEELPYLKDAFQGFTFYENTVSFSNKTNVGSPAVYGGYEYTPEESNKRDSLSLREKQNEALKVMPVLFDSNGFKVTVSDPTYANYSYNADPSIYDEYPGITAFNGMDYFSNDPALSANVVLNNKQNFFRYGLMRTAPVALQPFIYGNGSFLRAGNFLHGREQFVTSKNQKSYGYKPAYLRAKNELDNMDLMTKVDEGDSNNFLMMSNDTSHEPVILQRPGYVAQGRVDNTAVEAAHPRKRKLNGTKINLGEYLQEAIYDCDASTYISLAKWFDYLRQEGLWDNTRIVIGSDHGYDVFSVHARRLNITDKQLRTVKTGSPHRLIDADNYHPLLLVKDFDSDQPLTTDETFMTHAEVPTLATQGVIKNPVNPFTGKLIKSTPADRKSVHVFATHNWDPSVNNGYTFADDGIWLSVHDDVRKPKNWKVIKDPNKK